MPLGSPQTFSPNQSCSSGDNTPYSSHGGSKQGLTQLQALQLLRSESWIQPKAEGIKEELQMNGKVAGTVESKGLFTVINEYRDSVDRPIMLPSSPPNTPNSPSPAMPPVVHSPRFSGHASPSPSPSTTPLSRGQSGDSHGGGWGGGWFGGRTTPEQKSVMQIDESAMNDAFFQGVSGISQERQSPGSRPGSGSYLGGLNPPITASTTNTASIAGPLIVKRVGEDAASSSDDAEELEEEESPFTSGLFGDVQMQRMEGSKSTDNNDSGIENNNDNNKKNGDDDDDLDSFFDAVLPNVPSDVVESQAQEKISKPSLWGWLSSSISPKPKSNMKETRRPLSIKEAREKAAKEQQQQQQEEEEKERQGKGLEKKEMAKSPRQDLSESNAGSRIVAPPASRPYRTRPLRRDLRGRKSSEPHSSSTDATAISPEFNSSSNDILSPTDAMMRDFNQSFSIFKGHLESKRLDDWLRLLDPSKQTLPTRPIFSQYHSSGQSEHAFFLPGGYLAHSINPSMIRGYNGRQVRLLDQRLFLLLGGKTFIVVETMRESFEHRFRHHSLEENADYKPVYEPCQDEEPNLVLAYLFCYLLQDGLDALIQKGSYDASNMDLVMKEAARTLEDRLGMEMHPLAVTLGMIHEDGLWVAKRLVAKNFGKEPEAEEIKATEQQPQPISETAKSQETPLEIRGRGQGVLVTRSLAPDQSLEVATEEEEEGGKAEEEEENDDEEFRQLIKGMRRKPRSFQPGQSFPFFLNPSQPKGPPPKPVPHLLFATGSADGVMRVGPLKVGDIVLVHSSDYALSPTETISLMKQHYREDFHVQLGNKSLERQQDTWLGCMVLTLEVLEGKKHAVYGDWQLS